MFGASGGHIGWLEQARHVVVREQRILEMLADGQVHHFAGFQPLVPQAQRVATAAFLKKSVLWSQTRVYGKGVSLPVTRQGPGDQTPRQTRGTGCSRSNSADALNRILPTQGSDALPAAIGPPAIQETSEDDRWISC